MIRDDGLLDQCPRPMGHAFGGGADGNGFGNHRHVGDVRGRGLFWALEFVVDRAVETSVRPVP